MSQQSIKAVSSTWRQTSFLAGIALLAAVSGCSFINRSPSPERVGPPIVFYEADTSLVEIAGPPETDTAEPIEQAIPSSSIPIPSADARTQLPSDSTLTEAPVDSLPLEPSPKVSIDLPDAEKHQLWRVATDDLSAAASLLEAATERIETSEGKKELETVRGLIEQTQEALERRDFQAAANLAQKARILAEKLPSR